MSNTTESPSCEVTEGAIRLQEALSTISTVDQVVNALGIKDVQAQSEEFLTEQRRAVRQRFFYLCLQRLGMDLSTDRKTLSEGTAHTIAQYAEALLEKPGFDYAYVREWFLTRGQFEHAKAIKARREREQLKNTFLNVLIVLNAGGAKYLAYDDKTLEVRLVSNKELAHKFPVTSVTEISLPYIQDMAIHFEALKSRFDAKEIKVLPRKG